MLCSVRNRVKPSPSGRLMSKIINSGFNKVIYFHKSARIKEHFNSLSGGQFAALMLLLNTILSAATIPLVIWLLF